MVSRNPATTGGAAEQSSPSASSHEDAPAVDAQSAAPVPPDEFRAFLVALATDPAKLGNFIKDPDGSMGAAGIDAVDQAILKSGQAWIIHARLLGQRFSFTPPAPTTVLVVDMTRQSSASASNIANQPTVRIGPAFTAAPHQGGSAMFPTTPQ